MRTRTFAAPILFATLACTPQAKQTRAPTPSVPSPEVAAPRTIIIVRHAEKAGDDADPPLTEAGHARSRCLAQVLADVGVTHLFATEFQRNRDTLAPLAQHVGLTTAMLPAAAQQEWTDTLRGLAPGSVAVVAGHSNTIPKLVAELGGGEVAIDHGDYDWMLVLRMPERGAPNLLRMHYCMAPSD